MVRHLALLLVVVGLIIPGQGAYSTGVCLDKSSLSNLELQEGGSPRFPDIAADAQAQTSRGAVRERSLLLLLLSFAALTVVVGGKQGIKTLLAVTVTGAVVVWVLLPALLAGHEPIVTTVTVAALVTVVAMTCTAGASIKTLAAIIGTTGGVVAAGVLAVVASNAAQLVVLDLDEMQMLAQLPAGIELDYEGVLFAGMIIGALGAVMDVGMSITSAVAELKRVNPRLGAVQLMGSGMNVGRDIMSTMANTLILAYTGGALPLFLLLMAYGTSPRRMITVEAITVEIIRMMAGSVGLILCIPLTAFVAGILLGSRR